MNARQILVYVLWLAALGVAVIYGGRIFSMLSGRVQAAKP